LAVVLAVHAQTQTIPQKLAVANKSLLRVITVEIGVPPTIDDVLRETDVIVQGTLGEPRVYLSQDQTEVYSDYPILNPQYLFPSELGLTSQPSVSKELAVTQEGGVLTVGAHSYAMEVKPLPPFRPGTEGIFLLKRVGDKFYVARKFFGAFRTDSPYITPLAKVEEFAPELRSQTPQEAINRLVVDRLRIGSR
jgi:hypothetical protein